MPKVTFLPMNIVCDAKVGETLLDIAIENGVSMEHACGGFCACTTCHVKIESGQDAAVDSAEDEELDRLEKAGFLSLTSRLGCQTKIKGDLVVEVQNIDEY